MRRKSTRLAVNALEHGGTYDTACGRRRSIWVDGTIWSKIVLANNERGPARGSHDHQGRAGNSNSMKLQQNRDFVNRDLKGGLVQH